jgi:CheY-like chemotaxis protein
VVHAKHILVIEDDPDVRHAVAEALQDAGLRVDVAVDGLDGLERLRRGVPPALILLDMRMPRLGGEEFLRELRADADLGHIPVITMTASARHETGQEVLAHLHKPFDLDDLLGIVLSLVEPDAA